MKRRRTHRAAWTMLRAAFHSNPLRRGSDRAAAWIRLSVPDQRRLAAWEAAWTAVEPQWTRRAH